MRLMAMKLTALDDLLEHELKDLYSAEKMIIEALPKMMEAASSPELKKDFQQHLEQTREQHSRLEQAFDMLDIEPEEEKCEGIEGIIKEGEKIVSAEGDPNVKDAGLIAAAQRIEHYEIAGYGTAHAFAGALGYEDVAQVLRQTLDEEWKTDKLLTDVAEESVNVKAAAE